MVSLKEMDIVSDSMARSIGCVSLNSEQKLRFQLATVKASVVMLR